MNSKSTFFLFSVGIEFSRNSKNEISKFEIFKLYSEISTLNFSNIFLIEFATKFLFGERNFGVFLTYDSKVMKHRHKNV